MTERLRKSLIFGTLSTLFASAIWYFINDLAMLPFAAVLFILMTASAYWLMFRSV